MWTPVVKFLTVLAGKGGFLSLSLSFPIPSLADPTLLLVNAPAVIPASLFRLQ